MAHGFSRLVQRPRRRYLRQLERRGEVIQNRRSGKRPLCKNKKLRAWRYGGMWTRHDSRTAREWSRSTIGSRARYRVRMRSALAPSVFLISPAQSTAAQFGQFNAVQSRSDRSTVVQMTTSAICPERQQRRDDHRTVAHRLARPVQW